MPTLKAPVPKVAGPFAQKEFIDYVEEIYGKSRQHGAELFRITLEFGRKAEPCDGGLFWCSDLGGAKSSARVLIQDNSGKNSSKKSPETVARTPAVRYASSSSTKSSAESVRIAPSRKGTVMPPKGKTKVQDEEVEAEAEETEAEETARDYTVYADKAITASMQDFHDWLMEEVGDLAKMDTAKIVALAGTLRMEFQKSEFNQNRRNERKAAAEQARLEAANAAETEEEVEETEVTPAKRTPKAAAGKATTGKPAAGKPAVRRGAPKAAAAPY